MKRDAPWHSRIHPAIAARNDLEMMQKSLIGLNSRDFRHVARTILPEDLKPNENVVSDSINKAMELWL